MPYSIHTNHPNNHPSSSIPGRFTSQTLPYTFMASALIAVNPLRAVPEPQVGRLMYRYIYILLFFIFPLNVINIYINSYFLPTPSSFTLLPHHRWRPTGTSPRSRCRRTPSVSRRTRIRTCASVGRTRASSSAACRGQVSTWIIGLFGFSLFILYD